MEKMNAGDLPLDVLVRIFEWLDLHYVIASGHVNRNWREAASTAITRAYRRQPDRVRKTGIRAIALYGLDSVDWFRRVVQLDDDNAFADYVCSQDFKLARSLSQMPMFRGLASTVLATDIRRHHNIYTLRSTLPYASNAQLEAMMTDIELYGVPAAAFKEAVIRKYICRGLDITRAAKLIGRGSRDTAKYFEVCRTEEDANRLYTDLGCTPQNLVDDDLIYTALSSSISQPWLLRWAIDRVKHLLVDTEYNTSITIEFIAHDKTMHPSVKALLESPDFKIDCALVWKCAFNARADQIADIDSILAYFMNRDDWRIDPGYRIRSKLCIALLKCGDAEVLKRLRTDYGVDCTPFDESYMQEVVDGSYDRGRILYSPEAMNYVVTVLVPASEVELDRPAPLIRFLQKAGEPYSDVVDNIFGSASFLQ